MTDDEIVAIRDEHLPSQGEPFDCVAFARAIEARARAEEREACAKLAESGECRANIDGFQLAIAAGIRARKP